MNLPQTDGYVSFRGYRTWYRSVGEAERGRLPLLVLHGGPGATHQYLEPLAEVARFGRRVIFYDQIGCGRSDHPAGEDFYDVQTFVEELAALREQLGLTAVHVLGQSWGGMLAMEYALTHPAGLASIVVADSPASMTLWVSEANRLRSALPADVQQTLSAHEAAGTTSDPAYAAATEVFYRRHLCRLETWPDCVNRAFQAIASDGFVYNIMNGPSEFHVIGKLKAWDITARLHEIDVPTLLLSGAFDEATPAIVGEIYQRIPKSEWIVFPASSHMPHIEEPVAFNAAVRGFLAGVEA
ncbi:MAG TPA: proline iminopeptidase-family hydrolase [Candidatus Lustribacter sp.]|jgi:proline-specific peptidase|nr:proline iminopeptidase-family hydrolase [Candidatus Lustribacter sp.]